MAKKENQSDQAKVLLKAGMFDLLMARQELAKQDQALLQTIQLRASALKRLEADSNAGKD